MPPSLRTSGVRPGERYRDSLAGRRQTSSSGRLDGLSFGFLLRPPANHSARIDKVSASTSVPRAMSSGVAYSSGR
jgi:hypothetical protein